MNLVIVVVETNTKNVVFSPKNYKIGIRQSQSQSQSQIRITLN
jgi:hypothetical protein